MTGSYSVQSSVARPTRGPHVKIGAPLAGQYVVEPMSFYGLPTCNEVSWLELRNS